MNDQDYDRIKELLLYPEEIDFIQQLLKDHASKTRGLKGKHDPHYLKTEDLHDQIQNQLRHLENDYRR